MILVNLHGDAMSDESDKQPMAINIEPVYYECPSCLLSTHNGPNTQGGPRIWMLDQG